MTSKQTSFIKFIAPLAQQGQRETGVLASVTIAQAILESGWGESGLTKAANNLFGMKGAYNGATILYPTYEEVNGQRVPRKCNFKVYPSLLASVQDHAGLFVRNSRYHNLLGETNYKTACELIQQDGYATASNYATSLIGLIEDYGLAKYDITDPAEPTFYEFNSGWLTEGDKNDFEQLAADMGLKDCKMEERTMYCFVSCPVTNGDAKSFVSKADSLLLKNYEVKEI